MRLLAQESTVLVLPAEADASHTESGSLSLVSQIQIQDKLAIEDIRRTLDSQLAVKVLAFFDAAQSFGGFSDRDWAMSVAKRIARLSGVWCCTKESDPGTAYGMESDANSLIFMQQQSWKVAVRA